jgi:hypothetical protein
MATYFCLENYPSDDPGKHKQRRIIAVVGPVGKIHHEPRADAYSSLKPLAHNYSTLSIG